MRSLPESATASRNARTLGESLALRDSDGSCVACGTRCAPVFPAVEFEEAVVFSLAHASGSWATERRSGARPAHASGWFGTGGTFTHNFAISMQERIMPRGDKSKYTDKQKRKAEHIEEGYVDRGVSEGEAERVLGDCEQGIGGWQQVR